MNLLQRHLGSHNNTGSYFLGLIGCVVTLVPRNSTIPCVWAFKSNDNNLIWSDRLSCYSPTIDVFPKRVFEWIKQNVMPPWGRVQSKLQRRGTPLASGHKWLPSAYKPFHGPINGDWYSRLVSSAKFIQCAVFHFHSENDDMGGFPRWGIYRQLTYTASGTPSQPFQKTLQRRGRVLARNRNEMDLRRFSDSSLCATTSHPINGSGQTIGIIVCANMTENHRLGCCHHSDLYLAFTPFTTLSRLFWPMWNRWWRTFSHCNEYWRVCVYNLLYISSVIIDLVLFMIPLDQCHIHWPVRRQRFYL